MQIQINPTSLSKKLNYLNHAISSRTQLPILLNLLIEARNGKIRFSSTDLEIGIETFIEGMIIKEGSCAVPAKTFTELINSITDNQIIFKLNDSILEVKSSKTRSTFQTLQSDDFPRLYEDRGELIVEMPEADLKKTFSNVVFASSIDTTRPALSGVLVKPEEDGFLLVATDGFRLSLQHFSLGSNLLGNMDDVIVPSRVFREILSIRDVGTAVGMYVSAGSNQIIFQSGETSLIGRLIEAEFPNFEKIIPTDFSLKVEFDREELLKAVKICSIFARDSANIIKFNFVKDKLIVSSSSASVGENTVEVEAILKGEENEIAFNARYLLDLLGIISADRLVFEMIGPLNPGVFKMKDDNSFLHLIMPIRTSE